MKIIAFYLPQFHTIPENDEWWGKGFTDWINVKKAKPIFNGHLQPRVPLNNNYYDLSKEDTLKWQADLMNHYNIFGLCFYHYWFNGKLLLEKPSEILLKSKEIPMNFCFSWANEPWARTWDGKAHQVIMPQYYGKEKEWIDHFNYLLPFFRDKRYIKENNSPMFIIYKSQSIKDLKGMMTLWNKLACEAGFNGIHFVETIRDKQLDIRNLPFKARVEFEPFHTLTRQNILTINIKRIRRYSLKVINKILHLSIPLNRPFDFIDVAKKSIEYASPIGTYGGVFMGWDNTPRRGLASTIVLPPSKQEFKNYLKEKIEQTHNIYKTNYVFINAWNEWAEGTMLEPDINFSYQYLEAISECLKNIEVKE